MYNEKEPFKWTRIPNDSERFCSLEYGVSIPIFTIFIFVFSIFVFIVGKNAQLTEIWKK